MKFINIVTKSSQLEIDEILLKMSNQDILEIEKIYSSFDFVEYTNTSGNECMFCVVDDYELDRISNCYRKHNINFKFVDLTKDVLYDNNFKINYKNQFGFNIKERVIELISNFKYQNTTSDIVLDKIIEKGIESLTDFDHSILEKV